MFFLRTLESSYYCYLLCKIYPNNGIMFKMTLGIICMRIFIFLQHKHAQLIFLACICIFYIASEYFSDLFRPGLFCNVALLRWLMLLAYFECKVRRYFVCTCPSGSMCWEYTVNILPAQSCLMLWWNTCKYSANSTSCISCFERQLGAIQICFNALIISSIEADGACGFEMIQSLMNCKL